ncbi:integrase arm-type DNA-binding domain-containing protein [Xanthobacter sp. V0B-10]|uniref:tyrosine-type recombinase/integrase n=1 Tax=Xanthobacter albus TaxID=3119929 RepID=UPI00372960ED
MARVLNRLSARAVQTLKAPGRHADGGGLYLFISPDGSRRRWTLMFQWNGKQRELGLGPASEVSLAEAREKAEAARKLIRGGVDPIAEKRTRTEGAGPSFGALAEQFIKDHEAAWRNAKHIAQWRMVLSVQRGEDGGLLDTGYCRTIRDTAPAEITTDDVLAILRPIWVAKNETASRVRGRIEAVLDAAKAQGLRSGENPARWKGHLDHLLPPRQKLQRGHHEAMPYGDLPAFVKRLQLVRGMSSFALEFLILTAARSGEVRGARWDEIDLKEEIWTVPAERMKAGREHRVPLCARALEILATLAQLDHKPDGLIFPGQRRGSPLSDMALTALLRRLKVDATVHGFRSTFRDWAGDATPFPREVAEAALAHAVGDATEAAYRRGDALEKRRELMTAWSTFIEGKQSAPERK